MTIDEAIFEESDTWSGSEDSIVEATFYLIKIHTLIHTSHIWCALDLLQSPWISKPKGVKSSITPPLLSFFSLFMLLEATMGDISFVHTVTVKGQLLKTPFSCLTLNRTNGSAAYVIYRVLNHSKLLTTG